MKLVTMLLGLTLVGATASAEPVGVAQDIFAARIELHSSQAGGGFSYGGLIYGGKDTVKGEIIFTDVAGRKLAGTCPVIVRTRSLGATAIWAFDAQEHLVLGHVTGKRPRDLLGSYHGLQIVAAFMVGGGGLAAANGRGVLMGTVPLPMFGGGIDVSVPRISVFADPARAAEYPTCDWNRRIRTVPEYLDPTKEGTPAVAADGTWAKRLPSVVSDPDAAPPTRAPGDSAAR